MVTRRTISTDAATEARIATLAPYKASRFICASVARRLDRLAQAFALLRERGARREDIEELGRRIVIDEADHQGHSLDITARLVRELADAPVSVSGIQPSMSVRLLASVRDLAGTVATWTVLSEIQAGSLPAREGLEILEADDGN